jgi:uncharacterized protein YbbC (DUF1343 family)/CubicO group peptidase (beta-lactamase class C family)
MFWLSPTRTRPRAHRLLSLIPLAVLLVVGLVGCQHTTNPTNAKTATSLPSAPLDPTKFTVIDGAIERFVTNGNIPGATFWLGHGGASYHRAYGQRSVAPTREPMTESTVFDVASLTKVVATTPSIMVLVERGRIDVDAPVSRYLPEFTGGGKDAITIRQLMTHTSGLKPGLSAQPTWSGYDAGIARACAETVAQPPGTAFKYSDINFIVLGEVVRRVGGLPLDEFAAKEVFRPLKMKDTGFGPLKRMAASRIAPTELIDGAPLRGVVHDPTSRRMGGVAGHAGLFSTSADLARYAQMLLNLGELDGVRVLKPETVRLMSSVQSPGAVEARRGLGWDIDSPYSRPRGTVFPLGSYGHTGFTGCILWMDPFSKSFYVLLSNRVHPDGKGSIVALYREIGTLAAEAVGDFDFTKVTGALAPRPAEAGALPAKSGAVLNGIDVLKRDGFAKLKGRRVGLITNHTGRDREGNATIDLLHQAPGVTLVRLFSPEHGIRGAIDDKVGDSVDAKSGLPVISLYPAAPNRLTGMSDADYTARVMETRKPRPEQLKDLDVLVFDIQDIGCRFYTYISTMGGSMDAAAKAGIEFMVLDRVDPIGGVIIEGPVQTRFQSFVGYHSIPVRHSMTAGELAGMFNEELGYRARLTVVPVEGWKRGMWYDETGLPWIDPSPNIRNLTEATLYPGIGLIELNPVSVGRGTDTPFEHVGAPWIDGDRLANEMNRLKLPGIRFEPTRFTPASSVHAKEPCSGVKLIVTDRDTLRSVDVGVSLAMVLGRLYPAEFQSPRFATLIGDAASVELIEENAGLDRLHQLWAPSTTEFISRRTRYMLY